MAKEPARPVIENKIRGLETAEPVLLEVEEEEVGGSAISDSYALGWMGQVRDAFVVEGERWNRGITPDFDVREAIPKGYELYADAYRNAVNPEQIAIITDQIDANLERRARREQRGLVNTIGADLFTGIVDPINIVPVGGVVGIGTRAGVAKGTVVFGSLGAATEFVRTELDPTSNDMEQAIGVGGSFVVGGTLGGILGTIGKNGARSAGAPVARSIVPSSLPPPVRGFSVTSKFGPRKAPVTAKGRGSSNHPGVDFATPVGTPVTAPATGRVTQVTPATSGAGVSVRIDFGDGVESRVMHLSESRVKVGDTVRPGQVYALTGNTGKSTGPHLHYELWVNGKAVDPLSSEAIEAAGRTRSPVSTINSLEGIAAPATLEIDGRGVPVIIGPTGTGAAARYVAGRSADDIVNGEVDALEAGLRRLGPDEDDLEPVTRIEGPQAPRNATEAAEAERAAMRARFEEAGAYPNMPVKELRSLAARLAEEEGLVGAQALRRAKAIIEDMREAFVAPVTRRVQDAGADAADAAEMINALRRRADAARVRGDTALSDNLYAQAARLADDFDDVDTARAASALDDEADDLMRARDVYAGRGREVAESERAPNSGLTRDQARDAMRESDVFGDDLPFGMGRSGSVPHAEDGAHIVIDADAILASFGSKPWTRSHVEGVEAFPDDAFDDAADWLNFVVNHEVEHSVNPRMAGETLAAYENRINQRAYQLTMEGKLPFTASERLIDRIAIAPTPRGRLERIITDGDAIVHRMTGELADDFAVQTARNRRGGASTPGGSVFQRAQRWTAKIFTVRSAIQDAYLEMIGAGANIGRLQKEAMLGARAVPGVQRRLDGAGVQSMADFRKDVARAIVGIEDVSDAAKAAASKINVITREMEVVQRELGLFQSTRGYRVRADRIDATAARIAKMIEGREAEDWAEGLTETVARMRTEAEELRAAADEPVMPHGEPNYYTRIWDEGAIEGREDELLRILEQGYARAGHENPQAAAQGALDTIRLDPEGSMHMVGMPSSLKHRSIPVTNREVFDFIVQDPELVMSVYLRRVGGAIEMTRSFGDAFGLDAIDLMRADMLSRGIKRSDAEKAIQIFEDARDRIVGGFHASNPMSLSHRAVRAIKNFTNLVIYGKVLFSQVGDIARSIAVQGLGVRGILTRHADGRPAGMLGGLAAAVTGDLNRFTPGGMAKQAGEAMDIAIARVNARLIEDDSALIVTKETWFERKLAQAQAPFFYLNGMAPFTTILKEMAAMTSAHNIINEAKAVAAAVRAGGAGDARVVARLKALGIDEQDAMILADMPVERGDSGLILANVDAWAGDRGARARSLLLAAVNGEVRRSVMTPGPLDRPAIFDGVFHTKKGRQKGLTAVADAQRAVSAAEDAFRPLARLEETDPARIEALKELTAARGELTAARRGVGRAGRIDAPVASLPFQAQAFAMGAGSKILAGLLSDRDRARVIGIVSLAAAGMFATWLKSGDYFENMGWDEFLFESFDNSGIGAWVGNLTKAVDTAMDNPVLPGNEFDRDGKRYADEIGALGPGVGIAAQLIEAFVNPNLDQDDQIASVRRSLPFANLIWLQGIFETLGDLMESEDEEPGGEGMDEDAMIGPEDEGEPLVSGGGGRFGAQVQDLRGPREDAPPSSAIETLESDTPPPPAAPTNREVRIMKDEAKARARRKRPVKPRLL